MLVRQLSIIFIACFFVISCFKQKEALVIGTNQWIGYEPFYLASSEGLLPEKEFRLVQYNSTEEVLRAYRNGLVDVAAVTGDELFQAARAVPETRGFLVTDVSNGADALVVKPYIKSISDLKGKRIAVEAGALGAYMLTRILQKNSLNVKDIIPVYSLFQNHLSLFQQGDVDAVVTFEPNKTKLINAGGHEIFSSKEIPGEIVDILITREHLFKERRPELEKLIHIWYSALKKVESKSDQVIATIARHQGISSSEVITSLDGIQLPDSAQTYELLSSPEKLPKTLELLHQTLISAELIQPEPMPSNLLTPILVRGNK